MKLKIYIHITITALMLLFQMIEVQASNLKKAMELSGQWKFSIGDNPNWANSKYDDSEWGSIHVPSTWEDQGFHGYDGFGWYRRTFNGTALQTYQDLFFQLGYIDDTEEVFLNGHLIGFGGMMPPYYITGYHTKRVYFIPPEFVNFSGQNTIAIRVFDARLGGGMSSGEIGIYYQPNDFESKITLEGVWELKLEGRLRRQASLYREWNDVMVPMSLTTIGIDHYERDAYYRKFFTLPSYFSKHNLVLLLGKIDDFDEVYINGKKIGQTNDYKPLGESQSWQKPRVYPIPSDCLNTNTSNEILVKVSDIGVDMGIYEGPIAIVPKALVSQYVKNYYERK